MKTFIIISSIIVPALMAYASAKSKIAKTLFNSLAVIATLIFGNISAISIYQIIIDDTVFMTEIHAIFLNPFFLITGAYLGSYLIYRLIVLTLEEIPSNQKI